MTDDSRKGMGKSKANLRSVALDLFHAYISESPDSALAVLRG